PQSKINSLSCLSLRNFRRPVLDINRLRRETEHIEVQIFPPRRKLPHVFDRNVEVLAQELAAWRIKDCPRSAVQSLCIDCADAAPNRCFAIFGDELPYI